MTQSSANDAASAPSHGLQKELGLRDLVPMQILLVVGVTWAGLAARQGSDHVAFWVVGIFSLFLPVAGVVHYCSKIWPLEGGVYQWTKHAIGPFAGFLSIAAPIIAAIYICMAGAMLTYTSAAQIDLTAPIPQVLAAAFGGAGTPTAGLDLGLLLGRFAILALAVGTVAQYAVIIASISRLPMVAAWFTRLHPRYHMPTRSLTFIVVVAVLLCLLASAGAGSQEAFQLLATSGNVCYGVNYLLMLFAVPLVVGRRLAIVQASCCASAASSVWRLLHADRLRSYADCRRQQPGYLASRSGLPHSPRMPSERSCIGAVRARRR